MFVVPSFFGFQDADKKLDDDYQDILDYATLAGYILPSSLVQGKQNRLVVDLKDAGIWSKLDTFAVFAGGSGAGDVNFCLIDWKRLSQMTNVNGCTFSGNGFTGDGIDSYINTNFNLLTNSVNYTQDSASKFGWINGTPIDNKAFDGCISLLNVFSTYNSSNIRNLGTDQWRINTSTNAIGGSSNSTQGTNYLLHFYRDSATSSGFYKNTTLEGSGNTRASLPLISNQQTIMAGQSSWNFSSLTISAYGMGDDLSAENTDLYNALNTYISSL